MYPERSVCPLSLRAIWVTVDKPAIACHLFWSGEAVNAEQTIYVNGKGLPRWPAFDTRQPRFMRLGASISPLPPPDPPRSDLLKQQLMR